MRKTARSEISSWKWLTGALLPLALVGCGTNQQAAQPSAPSEQVAGERIEDSEVLNAIRQAGLPERFAFGGRVWQGHQLHWAEPEDVSATPTQENDAVDKTGQSDGGVVTGRGTAEGTPADQAKPAITEYVPLPGMMVGDKQIYRKAGLDEAVTDNIYLRAEGVTPTGENATTQGQEQAARIAFVEYDATDATWENPNLAEILPSANLQDTLTFNGQQWRAEELQVYDPDVFDEFVLLPQQVEGNKAYKADEQDKLYVMTDVAPPTSMTGGAAMDPGPVFIRYQRMN